MLKVVGAKLFLPNEYHILGELDEPVILIPENIPVLRPFGFDKNRPHVFRIYLDDPDRLEIEDHENKEFYFECVKIQTPHILDLLESHGFKTEDGFIVREQQFTASKFQESDNQTPIALSFAYLEFFHPDESSLDVVMLKLATESHNLKVSYSDFMKRFTYEKTLSVICRLSLSC